MTIIVGIKAVGKQEWEIDGKTVVSDKVQICTLNDEDPDVRGMMSITADGIKREEALRIFGTPDFYSFIGCEVEMVYRLDMKGKPKLARIKKLSDPKPLNFSKWTKHPELGDK